MQLAACLQLNSRESVAQNLKKAAQWIATAASAGAKLIVLPETFATKGLDEQGTLAQREPFGKGPLQDFLANQASRHGIWLVGGTIPIESTDPQKANASCLVFNARGECAARYDKMHLFDVAISEHEHYRESATIQAGDKPVVVETPLGRLGLAICYDLRFPELFRQLLTQGAQIIALPAAFTVPTGRAHWEVLLRARAIENFCYVLGAGEVGVHPSGRVTYGHSMIVSPWGEVLQSLDEQEGFVIAPIDLGLVENVRQRIPIESHRRVWA